jgi:hypothetical protein
MMHEAMRQKTHFHSGSQDATCCKDNPNEKRVPHIESRSHIRSGRQCGYSLSHAEIGQSTLGKVGIHLATTVQTRQRESQAPFPLSDLGRIGYVNEQAFPALHHFSQNPTSHTQCPFAKGGSDTEGRDI